jgi:hypothetical protein
MADTIHQHEKIVLMGDFCTSLDSSTVCKKLHHRPSSSSSSRSNSGRGLSSSTTAEKNPSHQGEAVTGGLGLSSSTTAEKNPSHQGEAVTGGLRSCTTPSRPTFTHKAKEERAVVAAVTVAMQPFSTMALHAKRTARLGVDPGDTRIAPWSLRLPPPMSTHTYSVLRLS